jgi:hypothetical protein
MSGLVRAVIYTDESQVRIVNPFRSYEVDWDAVAEFRFDPNAYCGRCGAAVVRLRSGSEIRVWGIQSRPGSSSGDERIVERLNHLLDERRSS